MRNNILVMEIFLILLN